jgi:hypothetical protein
MTLVYASMLIIAFYNQRALVPDSEDVSNTGCRDGGKHDSNKRSTRKVIDERKP